MPGCGSDGNKAAVVSAVYLVLMVARLHRRAAPHRAPASRPSTRTMCGCRRASSPYPAGRRDRSGARRCAEARPRSISCRGGTTAAASSSTVAAAEADRRARHPLSRPLEHVRGRARRETRAGRPAHDPVGDDRAALLPLRHRQYRPRPPHPHADRRARLARHRPARRLRRGRHRRHLRRHLRLRRRTDRRDA